MKHDPPDETDPAVVDLTECLVIPPRDEGEQVGFGESIETGVTPHGGNCDTRSARRADRFDLSQNPPSLRNSTPGHNRLRPVAEDGLRGLGSYEPAFVQQLQFL